VDDTTLLETGSKQIEEEVVIPPGQTDLIVLRGGAFAVPVWQASAKHIVGDYCQPNPVNLYYYKVTSITNPDADGQGTSGTTQPPFTGEVLKTFTDGNLVWTCIGSTVWGGVMPLYCPEIAADGVDTIITGLPELLLKDMSAKDVLAELKKYQTASQNFDYYVGVHPGTGQSILYTIDWNNPASVPFTETELAEALLGMPNSVSWRSFSRTRQGKVINAQTVKGPNGARGEIDGSIGPEKSWVPNLTTNRLVSTAHGFQNGDVVFVRNSTGEGNLPNPLREHQEGLRKAYYVAGVTPNTFYITYVPGGNQITFKSGGGGGTNYVVDARYDQYAHESYLRYGKVKRGKVITLNDPQYDSNEMCREYARGEVWNWYAGRDTIEITCDAMLDPNILVAPRKVKITNTAPGEGLDRTPYVCGTIVLSFSEGGIASWSYQLGDRYDREGDPKGVGQRLGQPFPKDTRPPKQITTLQAVENFYNPPDDNSYIGFVWDNPPDRDYALAKLIFSIPGTTFSGYTPDVLKPSHAARIWAYPGRDYDVQAVAVDTNGNYLKPLPALRVKAASRLLSHTFNPNFLTPNRIAGVKTPEGWFDVLGSGSSLDWQPTKLTLRSPTQGGAQVYSDRQAVQGSDPAHYSYTLEVQAAAQAGLSSKLKVEVSYYEADTPAGPGALITTQVAVSTKTVSPALNSSKVVLTLPSNARSLSIKAGIPSGVAVAGELYLLRAEVIEQYRVQPPTLAADTAAFGSFAYRYVRPGGEYAVALTPATDGPAPEEYTIEYYPGGAGIDPDNPFFAALIKTKTLRADQLKQVLNQVEIDVPMKARARSKWRGSVSDWSGVLDFEVPPPQQPAAPTVTLVGYGGTGASTEMAFAPDPDTPEPLQWLVWAYKESDPTKFYKQIIPGTARAFTFPEIVEVDVNYRYLVVALVVALTGSLLGVTDVETTYKVPMPVMPAITDLTAGSNTYIPASGESERGFTFTQPTLPKGYSLTEYEAIWEEDGTTTHQMVPLAATSVITFFAHHAPNSLIHTFKVYARGRAGGKQIESASNTISDYTAAARSAPDAPGAPSWSTYHIAYVNPDGRTAHIVVVFEKSTSDNIVRHEMLSPWVTTAEGRVIEDDIWAVDVSDDDATHMIAEWDTDAGNVIATPSIRAIDTYGVPSAWSPQGDTITAPSAALNNPTNLTADQPDPRDPNGAYNWKHTGGVFSNNDSTNGRYWRFGTSVSVPEGRTIIGAWRATPNRKFELAWRAIQNGLGATSYATINALQWDTWAHYKTGATPNATAVIFNGTVTPSTPLQDAAVVVPTYAYVAIEIVGVSDSSTFDLDLISWRDLDGVGDTRTLPTESKEIVGSIQELHRLLPREPLTFNGEILLFNGDVVTIGVP
jgi:hypothetical protein